MANTTNFGWETPDDTDLVKDGAAAMRTLGSAIDTSMGDLRGGTTGQILAKNTNTDMDFVWINNDQGDITEVVAGTGLSGGGTSGSVTLTNTVATAFDAKGDLIAGTGADTFAKRTVGANETRLVADSVESTGMKWVADTTNYAIAAKGDLLVGTAADTLAALTVGTNGHILTADSATATGLKWAANTGAGNLVTIATGTLSGASVTISGLSTYNNLLLLMNDYTNSTADGTPRFRINNDSTTNYRQYVIYNNGTTFEQFAVSQAQAYFAIDNISRTSTNQMSVLSLTNCSSTGFTDFDHYSMNLLSNGTSKAAYWSKGAFTVSAAVSSLVIYSNGGNWAGGTYFLYGA